MIAGVTDDAPFARRTVAPTAGPRCRRTAATRAAADAYTRYHAAPFDRDTHAASDLMVATRRATAAMER
jgi:hypothetical protein